MADDDPKWFRAKRYGYGAGIPLKWQGWAVILAALAIIWAAVFFFPDRPLLIAAVAVPAAVACTLIAAKTTRGGWRWRWGDKE